MKLFKTTVLIWMIINCFSCYHHKRISTRELKEIYSPTKITVRNIDGKVITNVRVQLENRKTKEREDAYFHKPTKAFYFSHIGGDYVKITGSKYRPQLLDVNTYNYGPSNSYDFYMVKKGKPYFIQYDQKIPCASFPKYIATCQKREVLGKEVYKLIDSLGLVMANDKYFHVEMLYNTLSWQPAIYKKKDGTDFHPYHDPILAKLRRSGLFQYIGTSVDQTGICDNKFAINYWPKYSWVKIKEVLIKYDLEVIRHLAGRHYVYLKAGDGVHEGLMEIWKKLIEEEVVLFIHPEFYHPVVYTR